MANPVSLENLQAAVSAYIFHGSKSEAATALGIPRTTLNSRLELAKRSGIDVPAASPPVRGRIEISMSDGVIVAFSDLHAWPGNRSTAFRALLHFLPILKPKVIAANGDMTDLASISRHPPLGWSHLPSVKEELDACRELLDEITLAGGKARRIWPVGNHDERFERRLAQVAPELKSVYGTSLKDHFPDWEPCYDLFVNNDLVIRHSFKGGQHAPFNNALWAGRTVVTGHLHSQKIEPITDLNGTRWGVDTGCLADTYADQFSYMQNSPRSWRAGFAVITYINGRLLCPELVRVVEPDLVEFRGSLIEV